MRKTLHMETTSISVLRTCAEIEGLLLDHNISEVYKQFRDKQVEGIAFTIEMNGKRVPFKMPFRWQSIQLLAEQGKTGYNKTAEERQARMVAARIVLRWIEAQLALIEVGMAQMTEVFLPYIMIDPETTFHDHLMSNGNFQKLLPQVTS